MAGASKDARAAAAAGDDVRVVVRSTVAGIEASFNLIEKMQSRTRLALALSLLDNASKTSTKFEKVTADLAKALSVFDVDERHYWISTFYTLLIHASLRRKKATYFTPPAIVRHLIQNSEQAGVDFRTARVIDPAAGGAAFVSSIAGRMVELGCSVRSIRTRLTGIEIDPHLALLGDALVCDRLGEAFDKDRQEKILRIGDSLQLGQNPIKYDAVFVNPPYGRILNLQAEAAEAWEAVSSPGHVNRYALFIDLAFRLAKPGGVVAVVSPSSFISGPLFERLRESIRSRAEVVRVDLLERQDVFHDVQQDACVSIFRVNNTGVAKAKTFAPLCGRIDRGWRFSECGVISTSNDLPNAPWITPDQTGEDSGSLDRCTARLTDYGVTPKAGYFVWNREEHRLHRGKKTRASYPLFWAKNVKPGKVCVPASKTDKGIDFVTFDHPSTGIVRKPAIILQRTTNSKQPRRLIAAVIPRKIVKKYHGYVSENHTILLIPSAGRAALKLLCRLLNSNAVDRRYRRVGGTASISIGSLRNLPLPDPRHLYTAMGKIANFEEAIELAYALSDASSMTRSKAAA
ncbi:MAG: N-6 DNA methylase [Pseudomonadota bacterium]